MPQPSVILSQESPRREDVTTVAKGGLVTLTGGLFGRGLELLLMIGLARILGPYEYGLYAIGLNVLRIAGLIAPFGLDRGVVRFGSYANVSRNWVVRVSLKFTAIFGFGVGVLIFSAAPFIGSQFGESELVIIIRIFALAIPFIGCVMVALGATTLTKRMQYSVAVKDVIQPSIQMMLLAALLFFGLRARHAAMVVTISFVLAFVVGMYFVVTKVLSNGDAVASHLDNVEGQKGNIRELLQFSFLATLAGVVVNLINRIDRLMVGYLLSSTDAGIYQAAAQSAIVFLVIMGALNGIFIPMIADLYNRNEYQRIDQLYKLVTRWTLYISFPIGLAIFFSADSLMQVVYGSAYTSGAIVLMLTALAQLINAGTGAVGPLLIMTSNQVAWFCLALSALLANIVLNWQLIPLFGLAGAGIASLITIATFYFCGVLYARYCLAVWPYEFSYYKGFVAALITAFVLVFIRHYLMPISALAHLMTTCFFAVIVFVIVLAVQGFEDDDLQVLSLLKLQRFLKTQGSI